MLAVTSPTDNFADRALAAHNRERAALGLPRLAWSDRLAADSQAWADRLGRIGHLAHPAGDVPEGENLWAGTRAFFSVEQMIDYWLDERRNFRRGRFPDNSATGVMDDVGHYTQIVWRATGEVGCALGRNGADEFLVCRYRTAGNVIGENVF